MRVEEVAKLKALGNAVVPAQAYPIFRAIMEIEVAGHTKIIKEDGLMRELIVEALKRVGINESDVAVRWDKTLGCYVIYVRPGKRKTEHERD